MYNSIRVQPIMKLDLQVTCLMYYYRPESHKIAKFRDFSLTYFHFP